MTKAANQGIRQQQCVICEEGTATLAVTLQEFMHGAGNREMLVRARVPAWTCDTCEDSYIDDEGVAAQHDAVCKHLGRFTPGEIKAIRNSLGLKQDEFAAELSVGVASVKRWEARRAIPGYLANLQIGQLADRRRAAKGTFRTKLGSEIDRAAEQFSLRQPASWSKPAELLAA